MVQPNVVNQSLNIKMRKERRAIGKRMLQDLVNAGLHIHESEEEGIKLCIRGDNGQCVPHLIPKVD